MSTAVSCWEWIMGARQDLELQVSPSSCLYHLWGGRVCFGRTKNDPHPPPHPCCFTCSIFRAVFYSRPRSLLRNAQKCLLHRLWTHKFHLNIIFLYLQILSKISAAWQWTVCRRVGLFAADEKVDSPLAAFSDNRSPPTAPNVSPHDIWIKFLARRFEVIKYYSRDQVR